MSADEPKINPVAAMENWKAAVIKEQAVAAGFHENWGYLKAKPEECKPRAFETRLVKYFVNGVATVREKRLALEGEARGDTPPTPESVDPPTPLQLFPHPPPTSPLPNLKPPNLHTSFPSPWTPHPSLSLPSSIFLAICSFPASICLSSWTSCIKAYCLAGLSTAEKEIANRTPSCITAHENHRLVSAAATHWLTATHLEGSPSLKDRR